MFDIIKKFDWHHWTLLAVGLVVTAGPDVAQVLGNDGFTGAAGTISRVVGFMTVVLGILKQSPLAAERPKPRDLGSVTRGLCVLFGLGFLARTLSACSMAPVAAVSAAIPIIEDGADLVCDTVAMADQNEPGWVKFLCSSVDKTMGAMSGPPQKFLVKVRDVHAYDFMKAHVRPGL